MLGEEHAPKFRDMLTVSIGNGATRQSPIYRFPKREACLMAMSYSYELQAKVYDRMTALENAGPALPQTYKAALLALVAEVEKTEQLTAELAAAQPAIEFVARHVEVPVASIGFRDLAKHYKTPEPALRQWLLDEKICFMQSVGSGRRLRPYKEVVMRGYAELKTAHSANGFPREDMYFTTAGQVWIDEKWQAAKRV